MNGYYILDGKEPKPVADVLEWGKAFEIQNRIVEQTEIGNIKVSTIFLGLDHAFPFEEHTQPILFETMIFGGEHDQYQERYCTWDEAVEGHKKACSLVQSTKPAL